MFFDQTFSYIDIPTILVLIFLECLLSADNALVLAAVVKPLPKTKRSKALWIGVFSAFILRAIAILAASFLIRYFYVQIIGAIYLLYLAFSFYRKKGQKLTTQAQLPLWKVVLQIEALDLIFAFDSIIAALGLTGITMQSFTRLPPKIWIVYLGGVIGLVVMRFSVKIFSYLMDRFARLEKASHYLIAWIGLKLGFEAFHSYLAFKGRIEYAKNLQVAADWIFWVVTIALFIFGFIPSSIKGKK